MCVCAVRVMRSVNVVCVCSESDAVSKCVCVCSESDAVSKCLCAGRVMRSVNVCVCSESDAVSKCLCVQGE